MGGLISDGYISMKKVSGGLKFRDFFSNHTLFWGDLESVGTFTPTLKLHPEAPTIRVKLIFPLVSKLPQLLLLNR